MPKTKRLHPAAPMAPEDPAAKDTAHFPRVVKRFKGAARHILRSRIQSQQEDDEDDCTRIQSLLGAYERLPPKQQSVFLSSLLKSLALPQIHLLLHGIRQRMNVNFVSVLPFELAVRVFSFLDAESVRSVLGVCSQWNEACSRGNFVWRSLFERYRTERCQCERWAAQRLGKKRSALPYREVLQRHLQVRSNWVAGRYRSVDLLCRDVGVITVVQFDASLLMLGTDDGHVLAVDPQNADILHSFSGHSGGVWALQFVGDLLATGSTDRTIRLWSVEGRCPLRTLFGHRSTVRCLALTASGKLLISGSRDKTVRIWDVDSGNTLHIFAEHHTDSVRCMAIQGAVVVTGSYDCTLRVWDVSQGACRHLLRGHTDRIYSVAFRDRQIVSGGSLGSLLVWDSESGAMLMSLSGHTTLVSSVVITPRFIASGSTDCTVRLWDRSSGGLLDRLSLSSGSVSALAADENNLVTGSDSSLKVWNVQNGTSREILPSVNVIWRVELSETMCVATGDTTVQIGDTAVVTSSVHIFHFA